MFIKDVQLDPARYNSGHFVPSQFVFPNVQCIVFLTSFQGFQMASSFEVFNPKIWVFFLFPICPMT
jgi:hypothetical protein